jgi:NADH-quinone oxidoreductase subunit N
VTITIGNIYMLRQRNIKRFLAFSSISQAGYILLGFIGISQLAMASVVYYIIIFAFSNLAAFGVITAVSNATGRDNIADYKGLFRTNPKLSIAILLAFLSLAGIPPLSGFFSKFLVFTAAAEKGFFFLLLITALNSVLSFYCYLRIIGNIFIEKAEEPIANFRIASAERIVLIICVAGILLSGFAGFAFEYIRSLSFGI